MDRGRECVCVSGTLRGWAAPRLLSMLLWLCSKSGSLHLSLPTRRRPRRVVGVHCSKGATHGASAAAGARACAAPPKPRPCALSACCCCCCCLGIGLIGIDLIASTGQMWTAGLCTVDSRLPIPTHYCWNPVGIFLTSFVRLARVDLPLGLARSSLSGARLTAKLLI